MERWKDGEINLKSYLKDTVIVRDLPRGLDGGNELKRVNSLKSWPVAQLMVPLTVPYSWKARHAK